MASSPFTSDTLACRRFFERRQRGSPMTYTTVSGHKIEYHPTPAVARLIEALKTMCDTPGVTRDAMVAMVYSTDNPIMDKEAIPGRGAVTAKVMANPAYRVMTD